MTGCSSLAESVEAYDVMGSSAPLGGTDVYAYTEMFTGNDAHIRDIPELGI